MPGRVMIVDDRENARMLMRVLIEGSGEDVRVISEASDGHQALAAIEDEDPNVVVLDERMPGISGIETAARILMNRPDQHIILCTAYLDEGLKRMAAAAGIEVCLNKDDVDLVPETIRQMIADRI